MTSTLCPFCEKHSHMTVKWAGLYSFARPGFGSGSALQGVATCDHCGRASLGVASDHSTSGSSYENYFNATPDENFEWFPRMGASKDFPDVPEHIAKAAKEAHSAFSINAFMAAILMARTVVEATAKDKGIKTGNLYAKIDEMAKQGIIRNDTKDAAHEIRHFGNDMAHGDIEDLPDADDVKDVLALMDEVLREVFQGPAVTARLRSRRSSTQP